MKLYVPVLVALGLAWAAPGLPDAVVRSQGGTLYSAGRLIIRLEPWLRGRVDLDHSAAYAAFGIEALDRLNLRWQVERISPLYRRPGPGPLARRHGCDLQYLLRLRPGMDVEQARAEYEALHGVAWACLDEWLPVTRDPNDTLFWRQWHLPMVQAPAAWDYARGDPEVLIAVLDNGTEWHHPDVGANLWVNPDEDLNANGRFDSLPPPDGDIDGIDQDDNGTVDDVIGYDFMSDDPNPEPFLLSDDHGTHCWGIANGVTDNTEGIAGVAWNCRSFAYRCGALELMNIAAVVSALYHCVGEGAWVVSMSFGNYAVNPSLRDACAYAWDAGLVLVAGAGNDGTGDVFYPAGYDNVVAVAASGPNDTKPYWSNFGDWVDITAPGDAIHSTVTAHAYGTASGTSMAAPLVAGALAWVKSAFPSVTNAEACSLLYEACDSMPDDYYRNGQLGRGRMNLARVILPGYRSDLRLAGWRFSDAGGNGRPDPGETCALIVTYRNAPGWRDATGVSAMLSSAHPDIEVLKPDATFPDIAAGDSADCSADSFVVRIRPDAPPQRLVLGLTVAAEPAPAWPDTTLTVVSGEPRLLLVDDDLGEDYERWYADACDSNGVLYDIHDVSGSGPPTSDTLRHYPVVFWFTGDDSVTTLTAEEQDRLAAFLDDGGSLMLSGQNIAQDIAGDPFLADYLKAELADPSTGRPYLVGIPGDPIAAGDTMVPAGGGGASNGSSLDGVRPVNGGTSGAWFRDYGDTTVSCLVRYDGDCRLVYFTVPFEAIDHATSRYLQRWTLVRRVLEYFGERVPGVAGPPAIAPGPAGPVRVVPNPVRGTASVEYQAPSPGPVELSIYSAAGRLVVYQRRSAAGAGGTIFPLDAGRLANGVYLVRVKTPGGAASCRAVVLR